MRVLSWPTSYAVTSHLFAVSFEIASRRLQSHSPIARCLAIKASGVPQVCRLLILPDCVSGLGIHLTGRLGAVTNGYVLRDASTSPEIEDQANDGQNEQQVN